MEKESPTGAIYKPDVFLETHSVTPDDNPSSSKSLAAEKLVQEEKHNLRREKHKNEALKAEVDAERQKNKTTDIGFPSSFGLCCLRNFRKKAVALAYVHSKLLN
ncbi:uncharacterized protein LOC113357905 isoform X7 [Papaver somniferum]|uniref:uncharacterized protein LOC113355633 isoform X7 n=1 Tax=Papaver somniferum TaxID=3469 RepID=UPI000E6FE28C|nr:uncharacterized protein LOC113355633 isoform X7 [Papaver somniferum]XP_026454612.1 uncharacterized protein LOC113355858 isoform X7 [Papaver somniferum]XP_026457189.1 uncharacterized protein LOC113357905 isoform X7 [Papaver somniferum]